MQILYMAPLPRELKTHRSPHRSPTARPSPTLLLAHTHTHTHATDTHTRGQYWASTDKDTLKREFLRNIFLLRGALASRGSEIE